MRLATLWRSHTYFDRFTLLECLSSDIMTILINTYGPAINNQTVLQILVNFKRLFMKQRNTMAAVMAILGMYWAIDHSVLKFIAQLKTAERLCEFDVKCKCDKMVDFTYTLVLYKLVATSGASQRVRKDRMQS